MPIIIDKDLPARKVLQEENIFVMTKERAETQDIRALKIAILNLMPTKQETEAQFCRGYPRRSQAYSARSAGIGASL